MSLLSVLFPQVRAEVLRLLFADAVKELHLRDLTRQSGMSLGTIQDELKKLFAADLVTSRRDGNRRYYRANASHPLFPDLRQIVLKTSGLQDVLASAAGKAASDVDGLDISNVGPPRTSDKIGQETNPSSKTAVEYVREKEAHPLLLDLMEKQKHFSIGGVD